MANDRLLEGVDITILLPTDDTNVVTLLTEDGFPFSRCSESSHFGAEVRDFGFLTQRCQDGLSGHTLERLSQILGTDSNP